MYTLRNLFLILFLKSLFIFGFILYGNVELSPDEAQYWTWSKQLDWGYYSKPPGIAWQIWMGTQFFGDTVEGIRFGSLLIGILLPLAVYWLALESGLKTRTAFWSALLMAFSPLGLLASFLAITDGGLVLFWTLACALVAKALRTEKTPSYLAIGFFLMGGSLFKWPIYYFWIILLVLWAFYPFFRSPKILGGICLSLLGLLPSAIWNMQHHWATFRHVFATIQGGEKPVGNFFSFLMEQMALVSPILFFLLLLSFASLFRKNQKLSDPLKFCGWTSLAILGTYLFFSIFKKMQGNWSDFAYPTAFVFLSWYALEEVSWGRKWIQMGTSLSILLSLFALSIPSLNGIPYKWNPFRQNMGWQALTELLSQAGYNPKQDFLFGDKYQMSSILSFYGPKQKRAYFLNLHGIRHNQFSFWPGMAEEQIEKNGYFVLIENSQNLESLIKPYHQKLAPFFQKIEFLGILPIYVQNGIPVKNALIFKCLSYNGKKSPKTDTY